MILVYPNLLSSVVASSENGSFPSENLMDDKPKKIWKATSRSAILSATVGAGANCIGLFNTNATAATITAGGSTYSIDLTTPHPHNRLWQSYTQQGSGHTVTITLTASDTVYAGVLVIGTGVAMRNPQYGLTEGRRDFSIIRELNNGAYYIRKRDSVRRFGASFIVDRDDDFYTFSNIADYYGPNPLAMLLAENMVDDHEWALFGHIIDPFSGSHDYYQNSTVSYEITEAV